LYHTFESGDGEKMKIFACMQTTAAAAKKVNLIYEGFFHF
jgi:hypothetical protein